MSLSEVAGARGSLLPRRRIAHCAFLSVPRGLQQRFGGRVGTYSGRGAKARSRGILACFLFTASNVWVLRGCRVSALRLCCALVLCPSRGRHGTLSGGLACFACGHAGGTPSPWFLVGGSIPYPGRDWLAAVSGCEGTPF